MVSEKSLHNIRGDLGLHGMLSDVDSGNEENAIRINVRMALPSVDRDWMYGYIAAMLALEMKVDLHIPPEISVRGFAPLPNLTFW